MGNFKKYAVVLAGSFIFATHSNASEPAARNVCKQFLEQRGYTSKDWGQYWNWTTVDNRDGSWSVGARFVGMAPGRGETNLYVSCVTSKNGDNWKLQRLTRLQ